ncbi:hypothetical protein HO291_003416 [Salmonella enterica]|nr:hypothetical protein [Salmonella enterica]
MQLLTHEAAEAVHWLTERMPDGIFDRFSDDMETALKEVLTRYGLDHELISGFRVKKLVGERRPLDPADQLLVPYQAHIYAGDETYAVIGSGTVFIKTSKGTWRRTRLKLEEVTARSLTRVTGTIHIKAKDI